MSFWLCSSLCQALSGLWVLCLLDHWLWPSWPLVPVLKPWPYYWTIWDPWALQPCQSLAVTLLGFQPFLNHDPTPMPASPMGTLALCASLPPTFFSLSESCSTCPLFSLSLGQLGPPCRSLVPSTKPPNALRLHGGCSAGPKTELLALRLHINRHIGVSQSHFLSNLLRSSFPVIQVDETAYLPPNPLLVWCFNLIAV